MPAISNEVGAADELRIAGITKSYLGVQALKGVDLCVRRGSIHALAGQNGAGKSTLVKILSGAETPDGGTISLGGRMLRFRSPLDAQDAGIQTIYQELSLVPQLSVAENIFLGSLPRRDFPRVVDWSEMVVRAREALARIGYELDVRRPVAHFSVAEQQAVELAKALRKNARLILLDEPTSTLPHADVERLFAVLRQLALQGVTLLYISHRMEELYSLCDRVSVLRDGRNAVDLDTVDSKPVDVVAAMLGKGLEGSLANAAVSGTPGARLGTGATSRVLMSVRGLSEEGKVEAASFDICQGEVLGVAGLVGSGQSELVSLLAGARVSTGGTMSFEGKPCSLRSPRDAIRLGIGLLPQDRKAHGFVPDLSVAANISMASLPQFSRFSVINERRERDAARTLATRMGMRIYGVEQSMKTLSGGTQQKAILARWLVRSIKLLICDEPTRGVDVGAKEDMYELIREFARAGGTVVVASSEVSETTMCDRVLVMTKGRITAELRQEQEADMHGAIIARCG